MGLVGKISELSSTDFLFLLLLLLLAFANVFLWHARRSPETASPTLSNAPKIGITNGWLVSIRVKFHYIKHGFGMIYEAYQQHPDEIFLAPDHELYVIPPKYIDEIKSQPDTIFSSSHAIIDYFLGSYTTLDIDLFGPATWKILHGRLGQRVGDLVDPLDEECLYALEKELQPYEAWTPVTLYPTMQRIVARMNARVFVGEPLNRDEEWLHASIDFSTCVFIGVGYLKIFPAILRPLAALFNPYIRRIHQHHRTGRRLMAPMLAQRRELAAGLDTELGEKREDMLQWLIDDPLEANASVERLVALQLIACFGATDGTTNHITNVFFDLAARWDEYAPELRAELKDVLEADGGVISKASLDKLSKLDSFMKESQRLNPLGALSFKRKLMTPYTLSDGTFLPKSTIIGMASGPMAVSPKYHTSPETFDGLRFHRMRMSEDNKAAASNAHQFTTTGLGSLMFGHGKYACPGRFFASVESKIVMVHVLQRYDLRLRKGAERPKNLLLGDANITDYTAVIEVRARHM